MLAVIELVSPIDFFFTAEWGLVNGLLVEDWNENGMEGRGGETHSCSGSPCGGSACAVLPANTSRCCCSFTPPIIWLSLSSARSSSSM